MSRRESHAHSASSDEDLASIVGDNIDALLSSRRKLERQKSSGERFADHITKFSGSVPFVYLHTAWFGAWVVVNLGLTPFPVFDAFPFGLLTMAVSLEAIFLATFVLLSQNRMQLLADRRADLDLHINLLAEHEITRILAGVHAIAERLGVILDAGDFDELKREVSPQKVMEAIEQRDKGHLQSPEEVDERRPTFGRKSAG